MNNDRTIRFVKDILASLLQSKRFLATVATLLVTLASGYGMDQELANWLAATVAAYVLGETAWPSLNGIMSLRFLTVLATAASALVVHLTGVELDPQAIVSIGTAIISIILGDSARQLIRKG